MAESGKEGDKEEGRNPMVPADHLPGKRQNAARLSLQA